MILKRILFDYNNFTRKANRSEYACYQFFNILVMIIVSNMATKIDFNTEAVMYLFYVWIIVLITFVPFQAVTVRRLNDLKLNRVLIVLNFLPIVNIIFKIFLLASNLKKIK